MPNDIKTPENPETPETPEISGNEIYIKEINRLKRETVPKERYEALENEKAELVKALADQDYSEAPALNSQEARNRVDELRKKIFSGKTKYRHDYDYFTDLSEFIKLKRQLGDSDLDDAELQLGDLLEETLDYADGDPSVFMVELQRKIGKVNINQKRR